MSSIEILEKFVNKYRSVVLFNKNILLAGVAGYFSGALGAQIYSLYSNDHIANAIVSLLSEYSVDIPLFAFAFYIDNKYRYNNPIMGRNNSLIRHDVKKIVIAISVSEVFYAITKIFSHYMFLQYAMEPLRAAMAGSLIAWIVFIVLVNVIGKKVKLFQT